jgi:hypothetical protein
MLAKHPPVPPTLTQIGGGVVSAVLGLVPASIKAVMTRLVKNAKRFDFMHSC